MAIVVTYSAPTITVTGGTEAVPARMSDILAASVAGGWGVVTNPAAGLFVLAANLNVGNGSTSTYLASEYECVQFCTGYSWFLPAAAATLRLGNLYQEHGNAGSTWRSNGGVMIPVGSTATLLVYGSRLDHLGAVARADLRGGTIDIRNSTVSASWSNSTTGWQRQWYISTPSLSLRSTLFVNVEYLFLVQSPVVMDGVQVHLSSGGMRTESNATFYRVKATGSSASAFLYTYGADLALIVVDPQSNVAPINSQANCSVIVKRTVDLRVVYNGVAVEDATVTLKDRYGTTAFTDQTAADGTIAAHEVTTTTFVGAAETRTDYGPFTLTVQHADYPTMTMTAVAIDAALDWELDMGLSLTDVRNAASTKSGVWYVRKTGDDANAGDTPYSAKLTLSGGLTALAAAGGGRLDVGLGTWTEYVDLAGYAVPIEMIGVPGGTFVTQAVLLTTLLAGSHCLVRDILVTNTAAFVEPGMFVSAVRADNATNVTLERVTGTCAADMGILLVNCIDAVARRCVGNGSEYGIAVVDMTGADDPAMSALIEDCSGTTSGWDMCHSAALYVDGRTIIRGGLYRGTSVCEDPANAAIGIYAGGGSHVVEGAHAAGHSTTAVQANGIRAGSDSLITVIGGVQQATSSGAGVPTDLYAEGTGRIAYAGATATTTVGTVQTIAAGHGLALETTVQGIPASVAAAILSTPANKLATNPTGQVEASNMRGTDSALLANTYVAPANAGIADAKAAAEAVATALATGVAQVDVRKVGGVAVPGMFATPDDVDLDVTVDGGFGDADRTALTAIKARTDTIGALAVTITNPLAEDGTITLVQGDDYPALTATFTGYAGPALPEGTTATLALKPEADYRAGTGAAETFDGACAQDVDDATRIVCTWPLTAAQTATLAGAASSELNYAYQVRAVTPAGLTHTVAIGSSNVKASVG